MIRILALCSLLLALPASAQEQHARMSLPIVGGSVAAAASGFTCEANLEVCESFNPTGYLNGGSKSVTESQAGTTVVNEDYANTTAVGCDTSNAQSLLLDNDDGTDAASVSWDNGSSAAAMYAVLYFKVKEDPGSATDIVIFGDTSCTDKSMYCWVDYTSAGVFSLNCKSHASATATASSLNTNTWYKLELSYANAAGGTFTADLNDVNFASYTGNSWSVRYYCLNATDAQGDNLVIEFDATKMDTSALPSCNAP